MSRISEGGLPFDAAPDEPSPAPAAPPGPDAPPDRAARAAAVDPTRNIVLEASAGTGKTTVLVTRYLNLLRAGIDPINILAITFTRQAAAEMRERIVGELRADALGSEEGAERWARLRDRLGEISISTIDAFCFSLLHEFPLEADLEPGFGLADETEMPNIVRQAVEQALGAGTRMAKSDADLAMLIAQIGPWRIRVALTELLRRRLAAETTIRRFLAGTPRDLTAAQACRFAVTRLAARMEGADGVLGRLLADGPDAGPFAVIARDIADLDTLAERGPVRIRAALDRCRAYFLTQQGTPRKRVTDAHLSGSGPRARRFRAAAVEAAPIMHDVLGRFDRDINLVMARGVHQLFTIAVDAYRRQLDARALLDFSDLLERAVALLRRMDEFARSRFRLESRYHHVLVDEFQDTSPAQWELVSLLVQSWGEGAGLVHDATLPPSVFVVGDRKQSIYRFRDADVAVLDDAANAVAALREPDGGDASAAGPGARESASRATSPDVRQSISNSFRTVPPLLAFLNDLFAAVPKVPGRRDAFRFDERDRFPVDAPAVTAADEPVVAVAVADSVEGTADLVAGEVSRLLETGSVRDRRTGVPRRPVPTDVAILFRSRQSHREFERAINARGIQTCVYKGLGFFDTDEIKDVRALIRYLADPRSELRAAALLRSRFIGISDAALAALRGKLAAALLDGTLPAAALDFDAHDRTVLDLARDTVPGWIGLVDRLPPAEVLDRVLAMSAYSIELGEGHPAQARENVKKIRNLVRRVQNRGYATMAHVADHIDHLSGDVSNAVVDAFDAVNLMTVHAAKGLEFPIVMLVDLGRGTGLSGAAIRVATDTAGKPWVSVSPYRTPADQEERLRDLEETKRLLYVAATRARDRLYLSAVLDDAGAIACNPGSLAEALPAPLVDLIAHAATVRDTVRWTGTSGQPHRLAVVDRA
ncbi:MAG: AAA family ATPase [Acidobacteria bacterium]|nr:AAA family ATPase [Acidobacteriota bacterium]